MIGSLYSGISGLKANTSAMAVIGDNIANVDTTGFKTSRVSFANIFSASLSGSGPQIGRGVTLNGVNPQWEAGSMENTNNATDLSINGTGLFMVSDPSDGISYYTRAGKFEWDKDGNMVTPDGYVVQGYAIDATTGAMGAIGDVHLPNGTSAPSQTAAISLGLNLSSSAADGETFTSSMTIYDSLGTENTMDIEFTKVAAGWDWAVTPTPSTITCSTNGQIRFDGDGEIDPAATQWREGAGAYSSADPSITLTGGGPAASPQAITWTYLDETGTASDGSITGYSAPESSKTAQSQDGFPSGTLQSVSVDEDGYFTGVYSNGAKEPFAQIALADFASYSGLSKQGSNLYAESLSSGQPIVGPPNSSGLGSIAPSTLEMSNVDLGTEFVEMITTQRAFQANSKVITTSDEILGDLLNIKR